MTARVFVLIGLALAVPLRADDLPKDLSLVPANSLGFAHIKIAEAVRGPAFAGLRETIAGAGPKALAAFDAQFVPEPTSIDRVTFAIVPVDAPEPQLLMIVRCSRKFDAARLAATYCPGAKKVDGMYTRDDDSALATFDDEVIVAGTPLTVKAALAGKAQPAHLKERLARAAGGKATLFASVARKGLPLPPGFETQVPPPLRPLAKADEVTLALTLTDTLAAALEAKFPGEAEAKAAEAALLDLAKQGRMQVAQLRADAEKKLFEPPPAGRSRPIDDAPEAAMMLYSLALTKQADDLLANLPLKRDGTALTLSGSVAADKLGSPAVTATMVGLLLPAVQKVREAAARQQSMNNLKQIGLAMHSHHDLNNALPAASITDKAGKPLLSWRVAILQHLDQGRLYGQFKLDEPWDSDHNKKLIPLMPQVYADPRVGPQPGMTTYKVFVGKEAAFLIGKGRTFAEFTDGLSNTAMAVSAGDPVPWTKPEDLVYDGKNLPDLKCPGDILLVALCDGSVRVFNLKSVEKSVLKAYITPNGGEVVREP